MTIQKSLNRELKLRKQKYGMRGSGAGADRRPEAVRIDRGLPKRLIKKV